VKCLDLTITVDVGRKAETDVIEKSPFQAALNNVQPASKVPFEEERLGSRARKTIPKPLC